MKFLSVAIQMKTVEEHFPVELFIMLYKPLFICKTFQNVISLKIFETLAHLSLGGTGTRYQPTALNT